MPTEPAWGMTARSVRLRRLAQVFAALAALAIAPLDCATYDGLLEGQSADGGLGDHQDRDASADGCAFLGDGACDDPAVRPDTSVGDVSRNDSGDLPDGASADQANEWGPSEARADNVVDRASSDASNIAEAGDVEADAFDVSDVETGTSDASDVESGASDVSDVEAATDVSDARSVDVSDASPPTFYRAINVGGATATALMIDGQSWEAGLTAANVIYTEGTDAAGSGGLARVTNVPLIPPTDANRTSMIQDFAWGRPVALTMSNVPTGRYLVYMYTWEDNGAQTFDILLQGQVVLANYNSGANGHWEKLGPWPVDISAGTIALATSPTTGAAFANLCGIEVWRE